MSESVNASRDDLRMNSWTDKQLVTSLAKRYAEQSVIMQLMSVTAEEGAAFGIELLLQSDIQEGRPEELQRDGVLDAMIEEARNRIALRVEHGVYNVNG